MPRKPGRPSLADGPSTKFDLRLPVKQLDNLCQEASRARSSLPALARAKLDSTALERARDEIHQLKAAIAARDEALKRSYQFALTAPRRRDTSGE